MKTEILTLLRKQEGYVSGQEICRKLSVSRTAVWKVIGQLKEAGYEIEAVQNKGYRLTGAPDVITEEELASRRRTAWAGKEIRAFHTIDSTNNEIKRLAEAGAPEGLLAIAEIQESGRGRRGRSWSSPEGTGIWMSLLLRPAFSPDQAAMTTLVAAMAVRRAILQAAEGALTPEEVQIKWPNDIVVHGKKICGILTEMSAEPDYIHHVVIGIGINVNHESFPEEIRETASSLYLETGKRMSRAELVSCVWEAFEKYYEAFVKAGDLSLLREEYEEGLVNRGRRVCVLAPRGEWIGSALGISPEGSLLVVPEGETEAVAVDSGEVSVRGIYGYV